MCYGYVHTGYNQEDENIQWEMVGCTVCGMESVG